MEAKARLEDEVDSLQSKVGLLGECGMERVFLEGGSLA